MKPYPHVWQGPDHLTPNGHDATDFINPVGFGRALGSFLAVLAAVAGCAAVGIYLGSK